MEGSSDILIWTEQTISTWTKSGIKLQSGLSLDAVMHFEEQLNFQFPPDFKELCQKVNGFEDFDWNKYMFSLWSLESIPSSKYIFSMQRVANSFATKLICKTKNSYGNKNWR